MTRVILIILRQSVKQRWEKLAPREKRLILYLAVVLGFAAWKFTPRYWKPTLTIETPHYVIASTATREQTEEMGRVAEILYAAYSDRLRSLPTFQADHPKLKLLLYKDRDELRRINPGLGWAEAFYKKPYCRAYYSASETNPHHWMLHEAVHQLNAEVAHLHLAKWLEEGIADYFASSQIRENQLRLGRIDPETYPVWWIEELATDADLKKNLENGSVIPLRAIVTGRGGPLMRTHVNLYYLHWWSLTHFIFESEKGGNPATRLLQRGGDLKAFEELIGPVDSVQPKWHEHVRLIKTALSRPGSRLLKKKGSMNWLKPFAMRELSGGAQRPPAASGTSRAATTARLSAASLTRKNIGKNSMPPEKTM